MTTEERIAQIAGNFGQGFQNFQAGQDRQRAQALQDEARLRQEALQALEVSNTLGQQYGRVVDPAAIQPYLKSGDLTGLSEVLNSQPMREAKVDPYKDAEFKQKQAINDAQLRNINSMIAERGKKPTATSGGLASPVKVGAEERKSIGGIASGLRSLKKMEIALDAGFGPRYLDPSTPIIGGLIGDDPFSKEQTVLTDVVGRLQSGGAINNDEGARFKSMGPRPGDSDEIKRTKLKDQRIFLENKLLAMGGSPEKLIEGGFDIGQNDLIQGQQEGGPMSALGTDKLPSREARPLGRFQDQDLAKRYQELKAKQGAK
tara:strand:+ start:9720 stop:10667 length:948 start_codon:yes stop_codon:yes gene_type:complete